MFERLSRGFAVSAVLLLAACTGGRDAIIHRTSVGLVAARSAFTAEDERIQMAIVDAAKTKEEGEAKLVEHRKRRDTATKVFQAAWGALAMASLEPSDANMQRLAELAGAAVKTLNDAQGGGAK